jgi:hypothetical protein
MGGAPQFSGSSYYQENVDWVKNGRRLLLFSLMEKLGESIQQ